MVNKLSKLFLLTVVFSAFLSVLLLSFVSAVEPFGVEDVVKMDSTRPVPDTADSDEAMAGNVTELSIFGYTITQSWQGYFGNVTGTIMLADNHDNVMYNWSLASPEGEIYASTSNTISWLDIKCLENEKGVGFIDLETEFGIAFDDVDGVDETFSVLGTHEHGHGLGHDLFYTANIEFPAGTCASTHLFAGNRNVTSSTFQEVLMYDTFTSSVVFTSILDEETPVGFDQKPHDFQMLVLENGHGTDTATTTYYFWVELE